MKRAVNILLFLFVVFAVKAADFDLAQFNTMKNTIGKNTQNLSYEFVPDKESGDFFYYSSEKKGGFLGIGARKITNIIQANQRKKIIFNIWVMENGSKKQVTDEYNSIVSLLSRNLGKPKKEESNNIYWESGGLFVSVYADDNVFVVVEEDKRNPLQRWRDTVLRIERTPEGLK